MRKRIAWFAIPACLAGADWLTDGGNPQRTGWQRDEKILAKDNVKGMKALWKLKLDNEPRELHSLFPPLIVGQLNTGSGSWGRSGPAVGSDGTAYAPTGDGNFDPSKNQWAEAIVAVAPDGTLKDYFAPSNAAWLWKMDLDMQVTPAIFPYKGRELL